MNKNPNIQFIECNESDVDAIVKLGKETYFESFSGMTSDENMNKYIMTAFNKERIAIEITNPGSKFYFLQLDSKIVGYIKINENEAQTGIKDKKGFELERIYIRKEYQGMGLGRVLIRKAIELALAKNKKYLWVGVWEKNLKAIQFYEKMGLRKFAFHDFYMGDEQQMDYLMRIEIE